MQLIQRGCVVISKAPLIYLFVFIFGTLIGSFLNVVILRYNTGKNILGRKERSVCFSCAKTLDWYELVPMAIFERFTFFWIDDTGMLFASVSSLAVAALYAVIWSILIVITVYDFRHKIIPDGLVYSFIGLSFLAAIVSGNISSALIGGLAFFAFFGGLWLVSGGRWLGFGDAKLVIGVGFLLGFANGLSALTLAFWIGAIVSLVLIGFGKLAAMPAVKKNVLKVVPFERLRRRPPAHTMKSEIPFAPFIIVGTLIAFFCSIDIFGTTQFLSM